MARGKEYKRKNEKTPGKKQGIHKCNSRRKRHKYNSSKELRAKIIKKE